jgi:kynureninase
MMAELRLHCILNCIRISTNDKGYLTTEQIIKAIDDNASSTALVLLSAIQFYTGQYLMICSVVRVG